MKTNGVNEIDMDNWKDASNILTSSLWNFPNRGNSFGKLNFYGGCIPDVYTQVIERFSKKDDLVVDLFAGSGTSGLVAKSLGRHWLGVEINPDTAEKAQDLIEEDDNVWGVFAKVSVADSTSHTIPAVVQVDALHSGKVQADLVLLHPPYGSVISYGNESSNLCNYTDLGSFYGAFGCVALNAFEITKDKGYACLVVGDIYKNGQLEPLSYRCMDQMCYKGWTLKAHIVKNIAGNETGKGKNANLWRRRCLQHGLYTFDHENIFLFRKES